MHDHEGGAASICGKIVHNYLSDCNSAVYACAFEIFSHRVRIMIQLAIF